MAINSAAKMEDNEAFSRSPGQRLKILEVSGHILQYSNPAVQLMEVDREGRWAPVCAELSNIEINGALTNA